MRVCTSKPGKDLTSYLAPERTPLRGGLVGFLLSIEAFSIRFDVATILTADILRSPEDLRLSLAGNRICLEQTI